MIVVKTRTYFHFGRVYIIYNNATFMSRLDGAETQDVDSLWAKGGCVVMTDPRYPELYERDEARKTKSGAMQYFLAGMLGAVLPIRYSGKLYLVRELQKERTPRLYRSHVYVS
jgi:hypothetical protein